MTDRVRATLNRMTLEEKVSFLSGMDFWHTQAVDRLEIPPVMLTDGPHGLRKQGTASDHVGLNESVPATAFPTGVGLGASWDPALVGEIAAMIGREAKAEDVSVVLGPAVNIKRSPLCGRNFEYLSEDPYLASRLAKGYVLGMQAEGVGTSIKHFAVNNQEHRRMTVDAVVDERTLREIYLAAFESVVREAQPWTVMSSYNRVNGTYVGDDTRLLTRILREEWGFQGLVVSDWGAVNDRVAAVAAGLDLEMPASGGFNDRKVLKAVRSGALDEATVDVAAGRVLDLVYKAQDARDPGAGVDLDLHHERARRIAPETMVLLKNDGGVLPLDPNRPLAVIGEFAEKPRFQGGGSSHIQPHRLTRTLDAMKSANPGLLYAKGFTLRPVRTDPTLLAEAVEAARSAGTAVIFAGLPDSYESEGFDRSHLDLPPNQNELIAAVSAVCPRVVVVLSSGSPVLLPWLDAVPSVLEAYLPGSAVGEALADVLFGVAAPGGRLAETFPLKVEDTPSFWNFPGFGDTVEYREGILVGYRWYDTRRMDVLFPFGHGLSYTTFSYSDLTVSKPSLTEDETVEVSFSVTNTGVRAGCEVAQLYLSHPETAVGRAAKELKGFYKVRLAPGASERVTLPLDRRSFAFYDSSTGNWAVEAGPVAISVGASSRDLRLTDTVRVEGRYLPAVRFTLNSSRDFLLSHPASAPVFGLFFARMGSMFGRVSNDVDEDDGMARMMETMSAQMPLRAIVLFSAGRLSEEMLRPLLDQCNENMKASKP